MLNSNYKNWFLNYVNKYGSAPEIIMKRDHSFRVASNMNTIFKMMNLPSDYIFLADFIGLFHDIGRFEQWRNYHTFNDNQSVDHADYSAYNLMNDNLIETILEERSFDSIIHDSIKYHNKLFLPDDLNIKEEKIFKDKLSLLYNIKNNYNQINSLYAMAIRDVDKIDILYQYLISTYLLNTDFLPVTDKVANDFFNNMPINKLDRKNLNDAVVLRLSFINDINLTKSLMFIRNNNFLSKIYNVFPDKKNLEDFFDYAMKRLDELIEKNAGNEYVLIKK